LKKIIEKVSRRRFLATAKILTRRIFACASACRVLRLRFRRLKTPLDHRLLRTFSIFCFSFFISLTFSHTAYTEIIDRIAAIVNDRVITLSELNDFQVTRQRSIEEKEARKLSKEELRQRVLDELIDDALFEQALEEAKIEVTDDDLARAINNILKQNQISLPLLQEELKRKGIGYEQYKKQIRLEIRKLKFMNQVIGPQVKISDQDLRDYYQQHQEKFRGVHEAHIAQIFLPVEGITSQEQFDTLVKQAYSLSQDASKTKNAFAQLAKKHSKDAYAEKGGDLGMVNLKSLAPEISRAVHMLQVGEVSRPIVTEKAIFIVKLIALPTLSSADFERLREEIYDVLYEERIQEALNNYLSQQRHKAFIDIR